MSLNSFIGSHRALRALAAANGAPDLMRLRLGQVEAVVASSPSAAAALMREHDHVFATRPYFRTAKILTYGFRDLVFAPHSEHWRHVRRLCAAHVLSGARSYGHSAAREREVPALVRAISVRSSQFAPGEAVNLSEALYGFANEVICRAVSGLVSSQVEGRKRRGELFRELIEENTKLLGGFCIGDYFPLLAWADAGAGARARRNFERWNGLLETVIRKYETRRRKEEDKDFVDVLLRLQEEDGFELTRDTAKSLLPDMFAAGTDTSFIALEWTVLELVKNPAAMGRLRREVRSAAAPPSDGGADAFLGERREDDDAVPARRGEGDAPPAPARAAADPARVHARRDRAWVPRRERHPCVRQRVGRESRAGAVARPREVYPRTVPGRGQRRGLQGHAFPVHRRVCPGMQFALATLVRLFDWELPDGAALDMEHAPGLTPKRRVPLRLVAKPVG